MEYSLLEFRVYTDSSPLAPPPLHDHHGARAHTAHHDTPTGRPHTRPVSSSTNNLGRGYCSSLLASTSLACLLLLLARHPRASHHGCCLAARKATPPSHSQVYHSCAASATTAPRPPGRPPNNHKYGTARSKNDS